MNESAPFDPTFETQVRDQLDNLLVSSRPTVPAHQRPADRLNEWDGVNNPNVFQQIAEKTHGVVTVGNFLTLAGAAITSSGLWDYYKGRDNEAFLKIGVGRLLDVADGYGAKWTKTRSKLGAGLDATTDKGLTAAALALMAHDGTISKPYAVATAAQQLHATGENVLIEKLGGQPNPSPSGKKGMARIWEAAGTRLIQRRLEKRGASKSALAAGVVASQLELDALHYNRQAGAGYTQQRKDLTPGLSLPRTVRKAFSRQKAA